MFTVIYWCSIFGDVMSFMPVQKTGVLFDCSVVKKARAGDKDATAFLLQQFSAMIHQRAAHYSPAGEEEDFFQEGMLALYSAIDGYDFVSASFPTFARLCVDRRLISLLRRRTSGRVPPDSKRVPLTDLVVAAVCDSPEEELITRQDRADFIRQIKKVLSPFEFCVLDTYLSCGSVNDTVKLLGCDAKSVSNALFRIRTKLKKYKMPR